MRLIIAFPPHQTAAAQVLAGPLQVTPSSVLGLVWRHTPCSEGFVSSSVNQALYGRRQQARAAAGGGRPDLQKPSQQGMGASWQPHLPLVMRHKVSGPGAGL